MDNLIETPEHILQTCKIGCCLINKCERKDVFFQGEDADLFWEDFNSLCRPGTTYAEILRRLWDMYSEVARPCRT